MCIRKLKCRRRWPLPRTSVSHIHSTCALTKILLCSKVTDLRFIGHMRWGEKINPYWLLHTNTKFYTNNSDLTIYIIDKHLKPNSYERIPPPVNTTSTPAMCPHNTTPHRIPAYSAAYSITYIAVRSLPLLQQVIRPPDNRRTWAGVRG